MLDGVVSERSRDETQEGIAMPKTMRAAVLRELKTPLRIEEVPLPEPKPGEVLVKVVACGVCHSDVHAVDGDWDPLPNMPLIPGHEATGFVAACGAGVHSIKEGDAVGVPWMWSACLECESCLNGDETICGKGESTGYSMPGGYAEYLTAPAAFVGRLPQKADMIGLAPVLCAGVTVYRGLKRTHARPGQWAAVFGVGGLGHLAVQYAKAMGLRVAAVDIADDKLRLASELGADLVVNAKQADPVRTLKKELAGGPHATLVTTPATSAFDQAIRALRGAGTCSFIGMPAREGNQVPVSIGRLIGLELSLRGSSVGSRLDLAESIRFAADGAVKVKVERQPLSAVNDVFCRMRRGEIVGRVVLDIPA
jgi:propanol-preferring alcohol dehydrogenase